METITQYPRWVRLAGVLLIVAIVGMYDRFMATVPAAAEDEALLSPAVHVATSSASRTLLTYPVSGTIEAVGSLTVVAETAGRVADLAVTEGEVVDAGTILLSQSLPVLDAQIGLASARGAVDVLREDGRVLGEDGVIARTQLAEGVSAQAYDAVVVRDEHARTNARATLVTSLEGAVLALTHALDFVDTHESYFSREGLRTYRDTAERLYGDMPPYLAGSLRYGREDDRDSLRTAVARLSAAGALGEDVMLRETADAVGGALVALSESLFSGESDVLDQARMSEGDERYAAYFNERTALLDARATLNEAVTLLESVEDGATLHSIDAVAGLEGARIDLSTAIGVGENARAVARGARAIDEATMDVLAAERALGTPRAPLRAVVGEVFVERGSFVTPGTPLLTLIGTEEYEVSIRVPAGLLGSLIVDTPFSIGGDIVGRVARVVPAVERGSVFVSIALEGSAWVAGQTVEGVLLLPLQSASHSTPHVRAVPRTHVHFDAQGPFIVEDTGVRHRVAVLSDAGEVLTVETDTSVPGSLVPALGVSL